MAHYVEAAPQISAFGAGVVIIGNGTVDALGAFADRYPDAVAFYTDPERVAYDALGMLYGMGGMSGLKMLGHGIRAHRAGFRQGRTKGHPLQQGGVCLFDKGGRLLFAHRDSTAGDHLPPERILELLSQPEG